MSSSLPPGKGLSDVVALLPLVFPLLSSLLLSALFTYGLQGILVVQVYHYYISFPSDRLFWKVLVYFVLVAESMQTVLATLDAFRIFSSGWGKYQLLDDLNLLFLTPIISAGIGLVCHGVFAYRLYSLSKSKIVCACVIFLALLACASGFAFGIKLRISRTLSNIIVMKHIYLICGLWNGSGAACDVAIAGFMTFYLSRSSTGYKSTDVLLTRIIRLTIETGLFTATTSLASAILFVGYRENFKVSIWFVVPALMLAKLYAITILAMFNNRSVGAVNADTTLHTYETRSGPSEIRIGTSVVQQTWSDESVSATLTRMKTFSIETPKKGDRNSALLERKESISRTSVTENEP